MSAAVVLLWNGKKKKIKTSPNTSMRAILEEACNDFGISANSFSLVHKKNVIDLSQPFRFTGISQNAVVELKQISTANQKVRIGLSITDGRRLQAEFSPDTSLQGLLAQFVMAGQLPEETLNQEPTLVFMRSSYSGQSLEDTTLSSMGLTSGSARLTLQLGQLPAASTPSYNHAPMAMDEQKKLPPPLVASQDQGALEHKQCVQDEVKAESKSDPRPHIPVPTREPQAPAPMCIDTPVDIPEHGVEREGAFLGTGVEGITASLEALRSAHFDVDASQCVLTLMKYTQNLLNKPGDPRPRKIKFTNPAFSTKIAAFKGGEAFIRAIGYTIEQEGLSHEVARDPLGCTFFVMKNEDTALLQKAMLRLHQEADSLGIAQESRPKHRPVAPAVPGAQSFDPYKSHFSSTAATITKEYREPSITERKLNELKAKQEMIEGGIPDRQLQVLLPSAVAEAKALTQVEVSTAQRAPSDAQLLQRKMAKQIAQQRNNEKVPFKTRAMRELEQLQNAKVYSSTVIRIQFPDRVVLQSHFHPRESIGSVMDLIKENLSEDSSGRDFQLYVSPPKTILQRDQILAEAQLVPAALIYLSWRDGGTNDAVKSEGSYLKADLVPAASITEVQASYPTSTPLVLEAKTAQQGKFEDKISAGSSSSKKSRGIGKKPGWLKL